MIIATGGLPQNPELEFGGELVVSAWDVVGGDARLSGDVLLYDDDGTHSAMTTAEMLARAGATLEIVTPERTVGIDVGGMNMVPYARAFNETDTRITLEPASATRFDATTAVCSSRSAATTRPFVTHGPSTQLSSITVSWPTTSCTTRC